ncbi:putative Alpha-L-arabinofuranosidase, partial [Streptomyces azureus]
MPHAYCPSTDDTFSAVSGYRSIDLTLGIRQRRPARLQAHRTRQACPADVRCPSGIHFSAVGPSSGHAPPDGQPPPAEERQMKGMLRACRVPWWGGGRRAGVLVAVTVLVVGLLSGFGS